jgi:hypothetical protein
MQQVNMSSQNGFHMNQLQSLLEGSTTIFIGRLNFNFKSTTILSLHMLPFHAHG